MHCSSMLLGSVCAAGRGWYELRSMRACVGGGVWAPLTDKMSEQKPICVSLHMLLYNVRRVSSLSALLSANAL